MKKSIVLLMSIGFLATMILAACGGGGDSRVAIGPAGSGTQAAATVILEGAGIEEGDYEAYEEGFGNARDGLQDGNIDVSFGLLGLPAGSVNDLQANTGDAKLIGLTEDEIQYAQDELGYLPYTISADSYDFLEEDVETVTAYAVLVGNTNTIDHELGYELARVSVEHADENTHAQSDHMTLENALSGAEGLPVHPGAAEYYEEQGLDVSGDVADVAASEADRPDELILGTGSSGGTYYPLGGEMATVWNNHIDGVNVTSTETGASVENLASIGRDEQDLGMTVHVPALNAFNGEEDFEGAAVENFAFIGHIYPEVMQIITREATEIESLEDLK
ncbi:TAXI family TRAP transporter solute-binding subunit [Alkalibacillus haloalkaliphilus]|uniref:TAXI family TRAP transporter solute-binding subunit n=1 Tax=Alkalibacillus haloalkaliphilus TaxID=94136 RepID=UPI0002DE6AC1|nr:TAXI family TRAP transporter solute-binding subunit [Alkalibacillus haloalkaliphilus]